jgi:ERCC4-type nuclease
MEIKFTQVHEDKLKALLLDMLMANEVVTNKLGISYNAVELLHTVTIGQLKNMWFELGKKVEKLEAQDEWVSTTVEQEKLEKAKKQRELINLLLGYKRYQLSLEEIRAKKDELTKKLEELKESQKTPADRIKEIEEQLATLD